MLGKRVDGYLLGRRGYGWGGYEMVGRRDH